MKALVTFAAEAEFAPWRRLRRFRRTVFSPHPVYEGAVGEGTVRVVLTGMGVENARRAMQAALGEVPDVCISTGFAGGLKPAYRPGEILAARQVRESPRGRAIESDEALLAAASNHGAKIVDTFLTSRRLVAARDEKRQLSCYGDAVEMESFQVLTATRERAIPSLAIRVVCDAREEDLPYDFERVLDRGGRVRFSALLAQIGRRPHGLPALLRLGRQSRRAAALLAPFLDVFVGSLFTEKYFYELGSSVAAT